MAGKPGKVRQREYRERLFMKMKCFRCRRKSQRVYCKSCMKIRRQEFRDSRARKRANKDAI